MPHDVDNLADGSYVRFENGRPVEGRRIYQRVYSSGMAAFDEMMYDQSIAKVGDQFTTQYADLACISLDVTHRSQTDAGKVVLRIVAEYVDQGQVHLEGGAATATVLTSFDRFGERITVTYNGTTYVAQVEFEEPRGYMLIEQHQVFEGTGSIADHIQSNLNKLNAEVVLGLPARCWRISRIDYQLVRDWFAGVQKRAYRCSYYVESLPPRLARLVNNEPATAVPGWDKIVSYEEDSGKIPDDAVFKIVQLYNEINFLGPAGLFNGVVL